MSQNVNKWNEDADKFKNMSLTEALNSNKQQKLVIPTDSSIKFINMNTETKNVPQSGGYSTEDAIWHAYSPLLMREILRLFPKDKQIFDLGCGLNNYVAILNSLGYKAWGYDWLDLGSKYYTKANLAYPMPPVKANVISFEVGEHIPHDESLKFLDNIANFGGDVLLSWAIPGQAGIGHINCQQNEWVIAQMDKRGYKINWKETENVRQALEFCHCSWFRNTIMFFNPKK